MNSGGGSSLKNQQTLKQQVSIVQTTIMFYSISDY